MWGPTYLVLGRVSEVGEPEHNFFSPFLNCYYSGGWATREAFVGIFFKVRDFILYIFLLRVFMGAFNIVKSFPGNNFAIASIHLPLLRPTLMYVSSWVAHMKSIWT